jgi:membrane fusion protein, multidrug efflux system
MFMNAWLAVAKRENALLIPEEAIVGEGPLQIAFAVKDNKVERRVIKVGQRENGKVEVLEGLTLADSIVVRGLQRVRGGMTVSARPFVQTPAGGQAPAGQAPAGQAPAGQAPAGQAPAGPAPVSSAPGAAPAQPAQAQPILNPQRPQAQAPAATAPGQPQTARP